MKYKKGFTLAEILLVLIVISVIAAMTIPSMMKTLNEAQYKAGYKKAFNKIASWTTIARTELDLPQVANSYAVDRIMSSLHSVLSVKGYAEDTVNSQTPISAKTLKNCLQIGGDEGMTVHKVGVGKDDCVNNQYNRNVRSLSGAQMVNVENIAWIITDDNIAYGVIKGAEDRTKCATKLEISAQEDEKAALAKTCGVIIVDVNGLGKGPNAFEMQGFDNESPLKEGVQMDTLTGDRYKIYVGKDGISAGPRNTTATGRIMADVK